MTCRELIESITAYQSGDLEPSERRNFEAHLAHCSHCVEYLRSYEETIRLAKDAFRQWETDGGEHPSSERAIKRSEPESTGEGSIQSKPN